MQSEFEKELESEIYVDRLLVLLEQDSGFRQVLLSKSKFKQLSDLCVEEFGQIDPITKLQDVSISLGDELLTNKTPFEGMRDWTE